MTTNVMQNKNLKAVFCDDGTPYLSHYGVLGMKWGVRNAETRERYARERRADRAVAKELRKQRKELKEQRKTTRKSADERRKMLRDERLEANRNRSFLSDEELDRRINRLRKEMTLNQLTAQELTPGRNMVERLLVGIGQDAVRTEAKYNLPSSRAKRAAKNKDK